MDNNTESGRNGNDKLSYAKLIFKCKNKANYRYDRSDEQNKEAGLREWQ